jgi:replication factor A1
LQRDFNRFNEPVDVKIGELKPNSRSVNVVGKVVSKGSVREVSSGRDGSPHRVAEVLLGDETGSIYLTLWDDDIDKVEVGSTVALRNGYVNLFRGHMRLNVGRYGILEVSDTPFEGEVNTENNLSDKEYEDRPPRRGGGRRYGRFRGPLGA